METNQQTVLRRPAEWEPHKATILAWPHNRETWPDQMLERVEEVFVRFLYTIARSEAVWVITGDQKSFTKAEKVVKEMAAPNEIRILPCPINDMWVRDSGPVCVMSGDEPQFLNFHFNAWGEKYQPWEDDDHLPWVLAGKMGYPVHDVPVTLEGGAIECNGAGTLITTESVLLNPNRRNGTKSQIEQQLRQWLGCDTVIWLAAGLAGDDTDGHIDDLVRFVDHNTVVAMRSEGKSDINHEVLKENYRRLRQAHTSDGHALEIIDLPQPKTYTDRPTVDGSNHLPASYANFYITNTSLILPLYDERFDDQVISIFRDVFSARQIKGIPARDLVWGQGSFHCISQEVYQ